MKKVLVSACLAGVLCKYNALDNTVDDARFKKWWDEGRFVLICPEVVGGLSIPREPSERQFDKGPIKSFGEIKGRVATQSGRDVTEEYVKGAYAAVELAKNENVVCCLMKHRSPSCGSSLIYDGEFSGNLIPGEGVAVEFLRKAGFKCFSELELDEVEKLLDDRLE